jgi:hypothetical protein
MSAGTMQPVVDPSWVFANGGGDSHLGRCAICIRGVGRNGFVLQSLAQLGVGFAYVALQRVAAASLVALQVVPVAGVKGSVLNRSRRNARRLRRSATNPEKYKADEQSDDN